MVWGGSSSVRRINLDERRESIRYAAFLIALGLITKDQQFADKLRDTVNKLNDLVTQIDTGNGTVAQLVKNPSLYNNLDQMTVETRGLVTSIRENPKKYLTFHVKIF